MRKRRSLFNLANVLTLSRFFFAPVMMVLLLSLPDPAADSGAWKISLAMFIVLMVTLLTDLFDGMAARALKEVTNFGKIMDPVADSTFFMTLFFALSACPRYGADVSLWFPVLILYREVAIQILRRYAALKGHAVPAKMAGKIKTFSQGVLTAVFFLCVVVHDWTYAADPAAAVFGEGFLRSFAFYLSVFTVAMNYWSLFEYSKDVPELVAEYVQDAASGKTDGAGQ